MVHVIGERERNQDVDVRKHGHHGSSSIARTSSVVMMGALDGTSNTGNAKGVVESGCGFSPLRASSEIAAPSEMERAQARLRAVCITLSSRTTVLLMAT
jgi:hypothetical protein